MIEAVIIDSREPAWVQKLFAQYERTVMELDTGDLQVITSDDCILVIERKTPDDFLNSLRDDRLLVQVSHLTEARLDEQLFSGHLTTWPYLVITGEFTRNGNGKVCTEKRESGFDWNAIQGALLTIQEMGCFVVFCGGDNEYEQAVERLARRKRDPEIKLLPARPAQVVGPQAAFLASLPGIGIERTSELLKWSANIPAHALVGLTDLSITAPVPLSVRQKIRATLGLRDKEILDLWINTRGDESLIVMEEKTQK